MALLRHGSLLLLLATVSACGTAAHRQSPDDATNLADDAGLNRPDAGNPRDAGIEPDAGIQTDAGSAADASPWVPAEFPTLVECSIGDAYSEPVPCGEPTLKPLGPCAAYQERWGPSTCRYNCTITCKDDSDCPWSPGGSQCREFWMGRYCTYFSPLATCCPTRSWDYFTLRLYPSPWAWNTCDDTERGCTTEFRLDLATGRLAWIHRYFDPKEESVEIGWTLLNECDRQALVTLVSASQIECAPEWIRDCQGFDMPGCGVEAGAEGERVERFVNVSAGVELPRPLYEARIAMSELVSRYFRLPRYCH